MKWISKVDYEWHDSDDELPSMSSDVEFMDKDGNICDGHIQIDMAGGYAVHRNGGVGYGPYSSFSIMRKWRFVKGMKYLQFEHRIQ